MSYTTYLALNTGREEAFLFEIGNYTLNVSPMWQKALGFPFKELNGRGAEDSLADLDRAVAHMEDPDNLEEYEALNPENGWGDFEGARKYLRDLRDACRDHPKCKIDMSY